VDVPEDEFVLRCPANATLVTGSPF